jgi:nitrogen-specific signal transduction histidine kinase
LDAPVLVGDPDGCTVYVNPAFESHFGVDSKTIRGQSLSGLFEGGAREAILRAVADVCGGSGNAHFQLREGGRGYSAIASPISAAASSVGVIILLTEDCMSGERLLACGRAIAEPLDALTSCLSEIAEDLSDEADNSVRTALADAAQAVAELRKRAEELAGLLAV